MQRALISFIRAVDRQVGKSGIASIPNKDCVHGVVMKSNISIAEWTLRAMNISFVENHGRLYPREKRGKSQQHDRPVPSSYGMEHACISQHAHIR